MSAPSGAPATLDTLVDAIEGGYEFLLAYAAQGRHTDRNVAAAQSPRPRLEGMAAALDALPAQARQAAAAAGALADCGAFLDAVERDAAVAAAAIRLVLRRSDIGSQLVDNLNASIHLRAALTDLFLLDDALQAQSRD